MCLLEWESKTCREKDRNTTKNSPPFQGGVGVVEFLPNEGSGQLIDLLQGSNPYVLIRG